MENNLKNIPSAKPYFPEEDIGKISDEIKNILRGGRLILGPYSQKFEELFADYTGVKYAVSVNSCTAALEIAMKYLNVEEKEVIVPTNTFIASANAVFYAKGKPVLCDIEAETLCIDPDDVLKRITKKTKGIIAVHISGLVCPRIREIKEICKDYNLFLIEDCAHAHGAMIDNNKSGSLGDIGCFSFYPTKVMTTATGGMITTNDPEMVKFAKSMRHHGQGESLEQITNLGNDWIMNELIAVLGIYQLKSLEDNLNRRNEIAKKYDSEIEKINGVNIFKTPSNIRHSYYKYPVLLDSGINKAQLKESLKKSRGIDTGSIYYPPVHLQPVYKKLFGYKEGDFPVADEILKRVLCLPMYTQMTDNEIDYVTESLKNEIK